MLLHKKTIVRISHKIYDKEITITWSYLKDKIEVSQNTYINGYYKAEYSDTFDFKNLSDLENYIDSYINDKKWIVKSF